MLGKHAFASPLPTPQVNAASWRPVTEDATRPCISAEPVAWLTIPEAMHPSSTFPGGLCLPSSPAAHLHPQTLPNPGYASRPPMHLPATSPQQHPQVSILPSAFTRYPTVSEQLRGSSPALSNTVRLNGSFDRAAAFDQDGDSSARVPSAPLQSADSGTALSKLSLDVPSHRYQVY